jgi:hypothetical protein
MTQHSDFNVVDPVLGTDHILLLRTSEGANGNSRALISDFLDNLLALIGADDIAWTALNKSGSDLADLATKSHINLTDKGTNTHEEIDAALATVDGTKFVNITPFPSDIDVEIRDGSMGVTIPTVMAAYNLTDVLVSVYTPGTGGSETQVQVRRRRAGASENMLSTMVTLSAAEYTQDDGVIDESYDDVNAGDQIFIDIKSVTATAAPKGLSVALTFS